MSEAARPRDIDRHLIFEWPKNSRPILVTVEDEREFRETVDLYQKNSGRMFPTWSEILEVLRSLGYAKRIWKPVGGWSPLRRLSMVGAEDSTQPLELQGWFATAETQGVV